MISLDYDDETFDDHRLESAPNCATTHQAASSAPAKRDMSRWGTPDHDKSDSGDHHDDHGWSQERKPRKMNWCWRCWKNIKCGWWDKYFEPKSLERNFNGFTFCRELMRKMSLLSTFQSSSWDPNWWLWLEWTQKAQNVAKTESSPPFDVCDG